MVCCCRQGKKYILDRRTSLSWKITKCPEDLDFFAVKSIHHFRILCHSNFMLICSKTLYQVIFHRSVESFEKNLFKETRDNFVPYLFKISSELNQDLGQPLAMFGC